MNYLLNLKSFLKFLQKNKSYTMIDVFGLSVSLMFVIIIGVYTWQELSVDRFQEHVDEIYLLGSEERYELSMPLAYRVQERYPEVEAVCPAIFESSRIMVYTNENKFSVPIHFVDTTFLSFFSFPIRQGSAKDALVGRNAVISESFAHKAFPGEDPIGKSIKIFHDSMRVTVCAVMKDIRRSALPYADILVNVDIMPSFNPSIARDNMDNAGCAVAFIKTKQGAALQAKTGDMAEWFKTFFWPYQRGLLSQVILTPLRDFYFGDESSSTTLNRGDRNFVLVLLSIGFLILLFAVINYVNLTVAQTGFRAKEMATRRLLGSSRSELFMRMILESILLCMLSFVIALLLAFAVAPYASDLLQTKIDLKDAITPLSIGLSLFLIIGVGLLAGLLPAIIISNAKPIEVVRGNFRLKSKMVFSKFFITFQHLITIILLACSLTMILQINHLIHAPLGYNTHQIVDVFAYGLSGDLSTVINEFRKQACVAKVGVSQGSPMTSQNNVTTDYEGRNVSFQQFVLDRACCEILGIEILRENGVANTDKGWYFNEEAVRQMGIRGDETTLSFGNSHWQLPNLGVIKDFRLGNITFNMRPIMLQIQQSEKINPWNILVETKGDPYEAIHTLERIWKEVTGLEFTGSYIDQRIQDSFASQKRMAKIIGLFTAIAVVISLLGLLAMSTYFIQQRTTEISIRKVFGSSSGEVLYKLISSFLLYVGVAFVISIPFIWFFMRDWLSGYDYRISLSPLIFLAAGLFCLLISFATVFIQSWRAANRNPVESFRNRLD